MLEEQLYDALVESCRVAKEVVGYDASRFRLMLQEKGAKQAAEELILRPQITDGLTRLCMEGRLDLSVEAIVIEGPYKQLFSEDVLSMARKSLNDLNYQYTEWQE